MSVMSEAEAWRECAAWCAERQNGVLPHYLCNILSAPYIYHRSQGLPMHWPHARMTMRVVAHSEMHAEGVDGGTLDVSNYGACPQDARNDSRVIFCLLMAYECEEDPRA